MDLRPPRSAPSTRVHLLEADPDLAAGLSTARAQEAARTLVASTVDLAPGPWLYPENGDDEPAGHFGFFVLEGILARSVTLRRRSCTELLGPGDVLRPWLRHGHDSSIAVDGSWTVVEPVRLAVLDPRVSAALGRWPEVTAVLLDRLVMRSRWLAFHLAVCAIPRVADRLVLALWHLADRWGRVTPAGVVIPVPLSHRLLATIVGAHRPSVTTALGALKDEGTLSRLEHGGWLLRGEPPAGLREIHADISGSGAEMLVGEEDSAPA